MPQPVDHILTADLGGTHANLAVFAHMGEGKFELVRQKTYASEKARRFPALLGKFLNQEAGDLEPAVDKACIDFAGPVGPERKEAFVTNLDWGFTAREISKAVGIERVTLMNDFEAVGYGFEILASNRPETFVRLSRTGELPPHNGKKPTAVIIGAGTGLGTAIMVQDPRNGNYRPVPGEGGHSDFIIVDKQDFRIADWIRRNRNRSSANPIDSEKVVSGPGLANIFEALSELEPRLGTAPVVEKIAGADPYDRPALIVGNAATDPLCRKALDVWISCYARAAKNYAIFPLAPGGVFLAGGIAAKVLNELQSGAFMREFYRCDIPNILSLLEATPVFVITEYRIGLYGCANIAVHPNQLT